MDDVGFWLMSHDVLCSVILSECLCFNLRDDFVDLAVLLVAFLLKIIVVDMYARRESLRLHLNGKSQYKQTKMAEGIPPIQLAC